MIAPLIALLALSAPADAAKFRLERVEIVSDDTGLWLNYDVPMLGAHPLMTGVRLLEQAQLVWALPVEHLKIGTSLESISVSYERGFNVDLGGGDLGWYGGATTRLLMPRGAMAGVAWQKKRVRLAAGAAATSASTWARPGWRVWTVVPTLSVAIVTGKAEGQRRFRSEPVDRTDFRSDSTAPPAEVVPAEGAVPADVAVGGAGLPVVDPAAAEPAAAEPARVLPPGEPAAAEPARVLPPGEPARVLSPGEPAPPAVEVVPPTPQEVVAPTGPTAVEFGAPMQVVLPGDAPTEVIIGGDPAAPADPDDSSQEGDAKDDDD